MRFYSSLLKDLSSILNDADDFNVIIQVGETPNTKEFRVHSVIYGRALLISKVLCRLDELQKG